MPIDDASKIEENRNAVTLGQLSRVAYNRVVECAQRMIDQYNKAHPNDPAKIDPVDDFVLMNLTVTRGKAVAGFEFRGGSPSFKIASSSGQSDQIEVNLDGEGRMFFVFDGHQMRLLEDVVKETLEPVLFPK